MNTPTTEYDVLVAGGGLAGAALACALGGATDWRIGVLEPGGDGDRRAIALSAASERIFRALGLWTAIAPRATPIRVVHVSQRGRFGVVRLRAEEAGLPALGQVLFHEELLAVLHARLAELDGVSLLRGLRATGLRQESGYVEVTASAAGREDDRRLRARLVVAADGANSALRGALGIAAEVTDYGQQALVCELETGRAHRNTAYERFTADGPMAVLPAGEHRCALIWARPEAEAARLAGARPADLARAVQAAFGHRLGRLRIATPVRLFALRMLEAERNVAGRVVLLGNAAHTLHPVAAQGFNLTLRETAWLAELLHEGWQAGQPPGEADQLARFAQAFAADLKRTIGFTDALARLFTTPGLGPLRGAALAGLDVVPPLKRRLARLGMGLLGPVPRLAAGIPLAEDEVCTSIW
jgi:2-octaprenyl-6-methoxyphenol hydroxylase